MPGTALQVFARMIPSDLPSGSALLTWLLEPQKPSPFLSLQKGQHPREAFLPFHQLRPSLVATY